jgi:hypothetical protein
MRAGKHGASLLIVPDGFVVGRPFGCALDALQVRGHLDPDRRGDRADECDAMGRRGRPTSMTTQKQARASRRV